MRPLPTNRQVLTWLCICPVDVENQWQKPLRGLISVICLATNIGGFLSSVAFFLENYSNDLKVSLNGIYQIAVFLGMTYMYIAAFFLRKEITSFLDNLEKIYNQRKNFYNRF